MRARGRRRGAQPHPFGELELEPRDEARDRGRSCRAAVAAAAAPTVTAATPAVAAATPAVTAAAAAAAAVGAAAATPAARRRGRHGGGRRRDSRRVRHALLRAVRQVGRVAQAAAPQPNRVRHPPRPLLDAQVRRGAARSELPQPGPERGAGPPAERRGGDEWRRDGGEGGVEREGARNHDPARREALCDHVPQQRHALLGEGVVSEGLGDDEVIPRRRLLLAPQQQHLALHRAQRDAARQVRRVRREGGRGGGHEVFVPLDGDDLRREIARRRGAGGEEGEEARAGADVEDAERRVAVSAACGEERQGLLQRRCVRLGALGVVHHKGAPRRQRLLEPSRGAGQA
mmetsp:Transcript_45365/g.150379  ORF Transcript_45365/g.150379 Transcript_45365/m.150379 type:complete len:345 (+) Transcript_45365:157-1191(+)